MTMYVLECRPKNASGQEVFVAFASGIPDEGYFGLPDPYPVRLNKDFSVDTQVYENNLPGDSTVSIGTISINNRDGRFDYLLDLSWGGASLTLKSGPDYGGYGTLKTIQSGAVQEIGGDGGVLTIVLRDAGWKLIAPLQPNKFLGSGGKEGFRDLAGTPKPLCISAAKNISPVVVDNILLTYQINDGAVQSISAVYDDAVPLTYFTDFPTYAGLIAAKIAPGYFATCLAEGFIRLGAPPAGSLTLDSAGQFGSSVDLATTLFYFLTTKSSLTSSDLDANSFNTLKADAPEAISGIYYPQPDISLSEFLQSNIGTHEAFWAVDNSGKIFVKSFKFSTPALVLEERVIDGLQRQVSSKPVWKASVEYDRNLTVLSSEDVTLPTSKLSGALVPQDFTDTFATDVNGEFEVYLGPQKINSLAIVDFQKVGTADWLTLFSDGKFKISNPPNGVSSVVLRASADEFRVDRTLTVNRTTAKFAVGFGSGKRFFHYDTFGAPITATQKVELGVTGSTPESVTAVDNLGNVVPVTTGGGAYYVAIADLKSVPLLAEVKVTARGGGMTSTLTIPVIRGEKSEGTALDQANKNANWSDVKDNDGKRPQDGATVGAPPGTSVGGIRAEDLVQRVNDTVKDVEDLTEVYGDTVTAVQARDAAITAKENAELAEADAVTARNAAQAAQTLAQAGAGDATNRATEAAQRASEAAQSQTKAAQEATKAIQASGDAALARDASQTAQALASGKANEAANSKTAADQARDLAIGAKDASVIARDVAVAAKAAAETASGDSQAARNAAQTAKAAAETAQADAIAKANAAGGSATAASTSAKNSADSASAAATSSVAAASSFTATRLAGAALLPGDFSQKGLYFGTASNGDPAIRASVPDSQFKTVAGVGNVWEQSDFRIISTIGVFKPVLGRTYELEISSRVLTENTAGGNSSLTLQFVGLTSDYTENGYYASSVPGFPAGVNNPPVEPGFVVRKVRYVPQAANVWARPRFYANYNQGSGPSGNQTVQLAYMKVTDVTEVLASAASASAASTSASTANTRATDAGTSATAAQAAQTLAETARGQAQTSATNAATSETNALGSKNAAATSATVAATSSNVAREQAAISLPGNFPRDADKWQIGNAPTTTALLSTNNRYTAGTNSALLDRGVATTRYEEYYSAGVFPIVDRRRWRFTVVGRWSTLPTKGSLGIGLGIRGLTNDYVYVTNRAGTTTNLTTDFATYSFEVDADFSGAPTVTQARVQLTLNQSAETAPDGVLEIRSILSEDITQSKAAETSASAAATSASTASTKATEAQTSASSALTQATNAQTQAGQAKTFRDEASISATNALGSANTATTQAGVSTSNLKKAIPLADVGPMDPLYFTNSVGAQSPEAVGDVAANWLFYNDAGERYATGPQNGYVAWKKVLPVTLGRTYLFEVDVEPGDPANPAKLALWPRVLKGDFSAVSTFTVLTKDIASRQVVTAEMTITPAMVSAGPWLRPSAKGDNTYPLRFYSLRVYDITEQKAAAGFSSSAAGFASTATQKATDASQSAAAANTSKTDAQSAASAAQGSATAAQGFSGTASTKANEASQSRSDALGSASDAANSAVAAAGSADTAGQRADAAATSASTASTKATDAGTASTAAQNAQTLAETARGQAQTFANNASTSATTAQGHAGTASTQAGIASTSAASAQNVANKLIPSRVSIGSDFIVSSAHGAPDNTSTQYLLTSQGTVVDVSPEGSIRQFASRTPIITRGALPVEAGRFYRWEVRQRILTNGGGNTFVMCRVNLYNSDWSLSGSFTRSLGTASEASGWATWTWTVTGAELLAILSTAAWARALFWTGDGTSSAYSGAVSQVASLRWTDVTSEMLSSQSATAAAGSASTASTKASEAGTSADSATAAKNLAETARGQAQVYASNAATSETNALGSKNAASQSATVAATLANTATNRAAGNLVSKNVFSDGLRGDWSTGTIVADSGPAELGRTSVLQLASYDAVEGEFRGQPGVRKYLVKGWVKGAANTAAGAGIQQKTSATATSFAFVNLSSFVDSNPNTWVRYEVTVTSSAASLGVRPFVRHEINSGVRFTDMSVEDITSMDAAAGSASAAAGSASTAVTKASEAGVSANSALSAKTAAETAQGQAQTFRNEASTASQTAQGHATTATTQAGVASSSSFAALANAAITFPGNFPSDAGFWVMSDQAPNATTAQITNHPCYSAGNGSFLWDRSKAGVYQEIRSRAWIPTGGSARYFRVAMTARWSTLPTTGGTNIGVGMRGGNSSYAFTNWAMQASFGAIGQNFATYTAEINDAAFVGNATTVQSHPTFTFSGGSTADGILEVRSFSVIEITSERAAGLSATAAATSASTANTKASEAGTSADSATAAKNLAETARGQAQVSATNAATSETNALGSKNAASTSAVTSARAAESSGGAAVTEGRSPGSSPLLWQINQFNNYVVTGSLTPEDNSTYTFNNGVIRFPTGIHLHPTKNTPITPGRRYRATVSFKITADGSQPNAHNLYVTFFDRNGNLLDGNTSLVASSGATTVSAGVITLQSSPMSTVAEAGIYTMPAGTAYARVMFRTSGGVPTDVIALWLEDVESAVASDKSAQAANIAFTNASAKADAANQSAGAAQGSATTANTKAGEALVSANNAAQSYSDANAAKNEATRQSGLAAGSASAAGGSATDSLNSANASLGYRDTAKTYSDNSQASASVASGHASTAQTQAGLAKGYSDTALTSSNNAQGSANTAQTQAGIAATSANTASARATGNIVNKGTFSDGSAGTWGGSSTVADSGPSGLGRTRVLQLVGVDTLEGEFRPVPLGTRKVRVRGWVKAPSGSGVGAGVQVLQNNGSNYLEWTSFTFTPNSWSSFDFVATTSTSTVGIRPFIRQNDATATRWTDITMEDITQTQAAADSATAAAGSASTATTKASDAGREAAAALASSVSAGTQAGRAESFKNEASTAASTAQGHSTSAASSAGVASSASMRATSAAGGNLAIKSNFYDGSIGNWIGNVSPFTDGTTKVLLSTNRDAYEQEAFLPIGGSRRLRIKARGIAPGNFALVVGVNTTSPSGLDWRGVTIAPARSGTYVTNSGDIVLNSNVTGYRVWVQSAGDAGVAGHDVRVAEIFIEDVTESDRAAQSASAASLSSNTATTKADAAGVSASAAETAKTAAQAARGEAEAFRNQAASSKDSAEGSASTATSASGVAVAARDKTIQQVAPLFPGLETKFDYWGYDTPNGRNHPAAAWGNYARGAGISWQTSQVGNNFYMDPKGFVPGVVGKRYRAGFWVRQWGASGGYGGTGRCYWEGYNSDYTASSYLGASDNAPEATRPFYTPIPNGSWHCYASDIDLTQALVDSNNAAWIRPRLNIDSTPNNSGYDIAGFFFREVTSEFQASKSATAASQSATAAQASNDLAGQRASAAESSRSAAETAKGLAEAARSAAATSESNAKNSENTASTKATLASYSNNYAQVYATGNLVRKPEFKDQTATGWNNFVNPIISSNTGIPQSPGYPYFALTRQRDLLIFGGGEGIRGNWPGRKLRVRALISAAETKHPVGAGFFALNSAGQVINYHVQHIAGRSGFQWVDYITEVGPNVTMIDPWIQIGNSDAELGTGYVSYFEIFDVTESQTAKGSSDAASERASFANTKATDSQTSANASDSARLKAESAFASAQGQAGNALNSANAAQGHSSTAKTQADAAGASANAADQSRIAAQAANSTASGHAESARQSSANADSKAAAAASSATLSAQYGVRGGNVLPNSEWLESRKGWTDFTFGSPNLQENGFNGPSVDWYIPGQSIYYLRQIGRVGSEAGWATYSEPIPVTAGEFYQFYCEMASHRCVVETFLEFFNGNGSQIGVVYSGRIPGGPGGREPDKFSKIGLKSVQAPGGSSFARMQIRKYDTDAGQTDSWMWMWRAYVGSARNGQTEWNAYQTGSTRAIQADLRATVTQQAGVIAENTNRTRAYLINTVAAGSSVARMSMYAEQSNGVRASAIELSADAVYLGERRTLEVVNNQVRINGNLNVASKIAVGTGTGWAIQLAQKDFSVGDGDTITYGYDFGYNPNFSISPIGLAPLNSGESYNLYMDNVTSTSAVARLKISTPGTTSQQQIAGSYAGSSGPTRQADMGSKPQSFNNVYRIRGYIIAEGIRTEYIGPGNTWMYEFNDAAEVWAKVGGAWQSIGRFDVYESQNYTGSGSTVERTFAFDLWLTSPSGVTNFGVSGRKAGLDFIDWTARENDAGTRSATPNSQKAIISIKP